MVSRSCNDFNRPFYVYILYFHIFLSLNIFRIKSIEKNFNFFSDEKSFGIFNILKTLFNDYLLLLLDINQLKGIAVIKSSKKYDKIYFIAILLLFYTKVSSS